VLRRTRAQWRTHRARGSRIGINTLFNLYMRWGAILRNELDFMAIHSCAPSAMMKSIGDPGYPDRYRR